MLKYTLQLSDNNVCDILFDNFISTSDTDRYIRSLGISDFAISNTEGDMHVNLDNCYANWITPLSVARLLDTFLTANILPLHYFEAIKNMMIECKTGDDRLKKNLPLDRIITGHKTGTGDRNAKGEIIGLNDVGFVFLPDGKRYTIAVLIRDSSESSQSAAQIIADISSLVFDYLINDKN